MKKFNLLYAIGTPTIFLLLVILGLANNDLGLGFSTQLSANLIVVGSAGFFIFLFALKPIFKISCKKMDKQLSTMQPTYVFDGNSSKIAIDQENDKIVLTFAYNPLKVYTLPLSSITKAETNDFKSGKGVFEGTMRVAFEFWIDGQKISINTFVASRQKFKMDSDEVLTGIAKADAMVEILSAHLVK